MPLRDTVQHVLKHSPGGHGHDQKLHGRREGAGLTLEQLEADPKLTAELYANQDLSNVTEPPLTAAGEAKVRAWEEQHADDPVEYLAAFDAHGNLVIDTSGTSNRVELTNEMVILARGKHITHNHPGAVVESKWAPEDKDRGTSLSVEDVTTAEDLRAASIRAVAGNYVYSYSPKGGRWPVAPTQPRHYQVGKAARYPSPSEATYRKYDADVRDEFWPRIRAGGMTVNNANTMHAHEVMTRFAQETGGTYTKTRRK